MRPPSYSGALTLKVARTCAPLVLTMLCPVIPAPPALPVIDAEGRRAAATSSTSAAAASASRRAAPTAWLRLIASRTMACRPSRGDAASPGCGATAVPGARPSPPSSSMQRAWAEAAQSVCRAAVKASASRAG